MAGEDAEKSHEPTQKRLDDAREKGQIARSQDILTAAAMAGFLLAAALSGPALTRSATAAMATLEQAADDVPPFAAAWAMTLPLLPLVAVPALAVLGLLLLRRGLIFTPENLAPRLSRIDPVAAAAHRFGLEGLAEFLKGLVKMLLVGTVLVRFLMGEAETILATPTLDPAPAVAVMLRLTLHFLAVALVIALVLGGVDMLWQAHLHRRRNRMSRQDLVEEQRDSEGDPHSRAARRQRAQEIALNRMLLDVPKADVVITNPTHFAVALKWDRSSGRAPICVAKGADLAAARIRATAAEHGVPIHGDPPTARAIFATVEIGEPIRPDHYRPVAAAIRLAEAMRRRKRPYR